MRVYEYRLDLKYVWMFLTKEDKQMLGKRFLERW